MNEQQLAKKPQLSYTKDQVELVKSQIAPEATVDELKLFLYQAQRTGLDALSRQIYCIHRNVKTQNGWTKKMTIQTSIDGFRVIAERSGNYGGQSEPIITYKENGEIESCKLTVYKFRGDIRYDAATSVVYWDEYVQRDKEGKPMGLWSKMGRVMIQKVCEAVCLRKAFPQDLSGLYTGDEMAQSDEKPAYIKTHDNLDDLELAIDLCISTNELAELYTLNQELADKEVTKLFTKKKQTL
jgi:phage recombination protein Bet